MKIKKLAGITDPYRPKRRTNRSDWPGNYRTGVGDAIRKLLRDGWSVSEIEDELGCAKSTITDIKYGYGTRRKK